MIKAIGVLSTVMVNTKDRIVVGNVSVDLITYCQREYAGNYYIGSWIMI